MAFNWRREPSNPYLPADGSMAQMAANSMAGYKPLTAMTPHGNGMNGYFSNDAVANQSQGFSVPNQQHGGMSQPELEGYGASLQAASDAAAQTQAKEQQIADIQSKIEALQTRIAENQSKLKNWNDDDVANKVAALEARKFFNQDPTSIWRWKIGQNQAKQLHDETLAAQKEQQEAAIKRAELEKSTQEQKSKDAILNEVTNTLPTMTLGMETTPDQRQQYLNTLAGLKTKAQNAGVPIEMITKKEKELAGELPSIKLQNSYTNFENMSDLFDKKADAGGYANNLKAYKEAIWNEWMAHPEFQNIPAYRQAMIKAMNAHNPVQNKPGTKPSKRK